MANGALESWQVTGPVGKQICASVEGEDESFVVLAQNLVKELRSGLLFSANHIGFAAAGVNEKAEGERQSFFAREEGDFLFGVVLENAEIFLIEIRDDGLLFVENRGVEIYEGDAHANGLILRAWRLRNEQLERRAEWRMRMLGR